MTRPPVVGTLNCNGPELSLIGQEPFNLRCHRIPFPRQLLAFVLNRRTLAFFSTAAQPFSLIPTMWALPSVQPALYYRAFPSGFPIRRSPCPYYQTWQFVVSCVRTTRSS